MPNIVCPLLTASNENVLPIYPAAPVTSIFYYESRSSTETLSVT